MLRSLELSQYVLSFDSLSPHKIHKNTHVVLNFAMFVFMATHKSIDLEIDIPSKIDQFNFLIVEQALD